MIFYKEELSDRLKLPGYGTRIHSALWRTSNLESVLASDPSGKPPAAVMMADITHDTMIARITWMWKIDWIITKNSLSSFLFTDLIKLSNIILKLLEILETWLCYAVKPLHTVKIIGS